jgi:hypothetical protein
MKQRKSAPAKTRAEELKCMNRVLGISKVSNLLKKRRPLFCPGKTLEKTDKSTTDQGHIQGVPKVPHTFDFAISLKSLGARKKCWCQIQEEGWEILYLPS